MNKKNSIVDMLTFGFALFSMFFGAGNLIFPPYLGVISGSSWFITFLGFTVTAVGLALVALMAVTYYECDIMNFFRPIGEKPALFLSFMVIMCVGPLLVIPRTGATAYEMGIKPILGFHNIYSITTVSFIFYALTYFLTVRPLKVVDIIGKFLTPFLILSLVIIIVKGTITPIGAPAETAKINNVLGKGLIDGYQTMDCFVSLAVGSVLMLTLKNKGYNEPKQQVKMLFKSGLIACTTLGLIYCGLTYLGSTVSTQYGIDAEQSQIIVNVTQNLLGNAGKITLGLASFLACLTTSIGLTSASGEYLVNITKGKFKYSTFILGICLFGTVTAIIGVSGIVKIGAPILAVVYPPTIVLIILTFFKEKIKNDLIFKLPTFTAVIISFIHVLYEQLGIFKFITILPLSDIGFNWIIPSFIAFVIALFIKKK
ncbi:branched-chain amino acid transport system II carrier protein [Parvimonas parva]|uniref:Branched-chain amino acid transport system carrier protein n=1 Tax=Parvimonas parva TaxID=2769485 RepID=A0ABS1CA17_9FIRM|nr:branched-chain amino acid transport system II carrier protein [Parvimonas parva]MBK1468954.1 branched-chain amino acid transport system II carrier protein [Parvimonas parva]